MFELVTPNLYVRQSSYSSSSACGIERYSPCDSLSAALTRLSLSQYNYISPPVLFLLDTSIQPFSTESTSITFSQSVAITHAIDSSTYCTYLHIAPPSTSSMFTLSGTSTAVSFSELTIRIDCTYSPQNSIFYVNSRCLLNLDSVSIGNIPMTGVATLKGGLVYAQSGSFSLTSSFVARITTNAQLLTVSSSKDEFDASGTKFYRIKRTSTTYGSPVNGSVICLKTSSSSNVFVLHLVDFEECTTTGNGGAVYVEVTYGRLEITNVSFTSCSTTASSQLSNAEVTGYGGGAYITVNPPVADSNISFLFNQVTYENNTATEGNALFVAVKDESLLKDDVWNYLIPAKSSSSADDFSFATVTSDGGLSAVKDIHTVVEGGKVKDTSGAGPSGGGSGFKWWIIVIIIGVVLIVACIVIVVVVVLLKGKRSKVETDEKDGKEMTQQQQSVEVS